MDYLSSFHFLRPWWLLVVVPPVLVSVFRLLGKSKSQQWKEVIAPHLLDHLVTQNDQHRWLGPEVLLTPLALLVAIALAGPAYRLADTPNTPDDTTLLVVVDLSSSMAGQDIGPSRIGRLRLKLRDLIDLRRGARIGIIAVGGSAHVVMPPTDDGDALTPYVDVLAPPLMPEDGENFARAAQLVRELSQGNSGPTVALLAGDSVPPDGAEAFAQLQREGTRVVGWPVGTSEGVPGAGVPGLDDSGFDRIERSGAAIVRLTLNDGDLRKINRLLDQARTDSANPDDASLWEDSGYGLVFVVALCTLFWFRRGWVLQRSALALLVLFSGGCTANDGSSANDRSSGNDQSSFDGRRETFLDPWLTRDQQGRRLFEQGKYKAAAQTFRDPMWKGIAYYTAHDWKHAQEQFSRIDSVVGLFNLANAHAQAREIASAIAVYDEVLKRKPTFFAARKNRDYFREVLSGLQQTTDFDDLTKPDDRKADPTRAKLRKDQKEGLKDNAAEAQAKKDQKQKNLSPTETEQWMKRVATNPADFLRAKFSILEQGGGE